MSDTISKEQYDAVKKFARELQGCFENYKINHPDSMSDIVLEYVDKIITIHLQLAELDFVRGAREMAKVYGED